MRRKKKFDYATGKYYLTIQSRPNDITMYRTEREKAVATYQKYIAVGKHVEWLGRWDGKKFVEADIEELIAA